MLDEKHLDWLESRRLDVEVAARIGLHSQDGRIAFPYMKGGNLLYVKARDPEDKRNTRCIPAGIEQTTLWNEDCLQDEPKQSPLVITEGEPDALAVLQCGYQFVVSVPSGAAATAAGALSKAKKCLTVEGQDGKPVLKPEIAKFEKVVVLVDCDHDGLLLRDAIVEVIGEEYCWIPEYPSGSKDANDVLIEHGADAVRALVDDAKPVKSDGFLSFIDAFAMPAPKTAGLGVDWLQKHLVMAVPGFVVIGGQTNHGKSTVTQWLLYNLLWTNPTFKASIFHGEGHKQIPVTRAMKFWNARNPRANTTDRAVQAQRSEWIRERLAFIAPPQDQPSTFEWLLWAMERQALHRKRNVFVVDPWNEVLISKRGNQTTTEYVGEAIIKMKALATRLNLILIVTHHIAKPAHSSDKPDRYHLADSAHWANKADHVILVWKPKMDENKTRIEVAKSKDYDYLGCPGHVYVTLDTAGRFFDLAPLPFTDDTVLR